MVSWLLEGARGAAGNFSRAARHLVWYVSYCVDASAARSCEASSAERTEPRAAAARTS